MPQACTPVKTEFRITRDLRRKPSARSNRASIVKTIGRNANGKFQQQRELLPEGAKASAHR